MREKRHKRQQEREKGTKTKWKNKCRKMKKKIRENKEKRLVKLTKIWSTKNELKMSVTGNLTKISCHQLIHKQTLM